MRGRAFDFKVHLAPDRDKWWARMSIVKNRRFP
jgi:hypothetical protein